MKKKIAWLFVGFILSLYCHSQNIQYARHVIDTLSSQAFSGRGYVNDGIVKAADFIEGEYKLSSLRPFNLVYKQEFGIQMNIIDRASIDNGKLIPGFDFVVSVVSGSTTGKFEIEYISESVVSSPEAFDAFSERDLHNTMVVVPHTLTDENSAYHESLLKWVYSGKSNCGAVIFTKASRPQWDAQMFIPPLPYPIIDVFDSVFTYSNKDIVQLDVSTSYYSNYKVSNVVAWLPGTQYPDSFIVFCAHYDHLGQMGEVYFPGANDNASGVAMMLDIMRFYSDTVNRLPYSVACIAFASEEAGLLGSSHFVRRPLFPLKQIKFLINLDLVGTGSEGMQVVNGSVHNEEFDLLTKINSEQQLLPLIKTRGEACNSDHCPFHRKGVPSFFIYTLDKSYPYYHVPDDRYDLLPMTAYENLFLLLTQFCKQL